MRRIFFISLFLIASLATRALAAPQAAEFRDGRWTPVVEPTTQPTNDPTLDRVEQLLQQQRNNSAWKMVVQWLKTSAGSPLFDRGLLLAAEAKYQQDDRVVAFYYLDELLDEYPDSKLFYAALEKQYKIAEEFLNGHKKRVLFFAFNAEDEAVEMLYRVQQRSPGSPLAEKALLRTADYYYSDSQFDIAADAYAMYARTYPRSKSVPRVKLRQAYSSLAQFRGLKFDASAMIDARTQLQDVRQAYPELAVEENIDSLLDAIDVAFARKLYITADYYRRTHESKAAVYIYRLLIDTYPNTSEAEQSRKRLESMPKWSLEQPAPWPSPDTTQPTR